ncbi:hypothetical protein CR513_44928, partial [Mucuna pruriens]
MREKKIEKESEEVKYKRLKKESMMEFKDVFPKDIFHGLLLLRGIEHHIDLVSGETLPNRATYKINLEESRKQRKVKGLMEKGWVKENLSPCVMPVILVPQKDEIGGCAQIVGQLIISL